MPVAGLGTRLLPATKLQLEEMLPVGRKPVVQYVLEAATGHVRSSNQPYWWCLREALVNIAERRPG